MSSNTAASNSSDESFMDHSEAMEILVTLSEAELSAVEGWRNGPLSGAKRIVLLVAAILLLFPPTAMIAEGVSGWFAPAAGAVLAALMLGPTMGRKEKGATS